MAVDQILGELVDVSAGTDSCHPFTGAVNRGGYGVLPNGGHNGSRLAHRAALSLFLGRPVNGDTRHSCDNPPCCNTKHLAEGTAADNAYDRSVRGRAKGGRAGQSHCINGHELTPENVYLKIRPPGYQVRECIPCRKVNNRKQAATRRTARQIRKGLIQDGK